jgi:hypothetical protein
MVNRSIIKPSVIKAINDTTATFQFVVVRLTGKDRPEKGMFSRVPSYIKAKGR